MRTPSPGTEASERAAANLRMERLSRKWSMVRLAQELRDHRCPSHPDGWEVSAAVINHIENGVSAQGGYPAHVRRITLDEIAIFSEVLGVPAENLME